MDEPTYTEIAPHAGPQYDAFCSPADILIYGGSAGCGKSFYLLAEPLRHIDDPNFGGVIFRRLSTEIRKEGSLWDESCTLYSELGAEPTETKLTQTFPSGCKIKFDHLEHEKTKKNWHGSAICYLGFDELTEFTESQFWYMTSRNRTKSGCTIAPYIRATCNPEEGWVARLIDWWIDDEGFAIPERSGVLRWFYRIKDTMQWYDSREEAEEANPEQVNPATGEQIPPRSFTFVAGKLEDNPTLERRDPNYRSALIALPDVERQRLLEGNWKISNRGESYWPGHYFDDSIWVDDWPGHMDLIVGALDPASGKPKGDFPAFCLLGTNGDGNVYMNFLMERLPYQELREEMIRWMLTQRPHVPEMISIENIPYFQKGRPLDLRYAEIERGFIGEMNRANILCNVMLNSPEGRNKEARIIAGWDSIVTERKIRLIRSKGSEEALYQWKKFTGQKNRSGYHDDAPDVGEQAIRCYAFVREGQ